MSDLYNHINVSSTRVQPGELWRSKDEIARRAAAARAQWDKLDDDERQAVVVIVTDALLLLLETASEWIPDSVEPKSGHRLDVNIGINLHEISEQVVAQRVEAERQDAHATKDLLRIAASAKKAKEANP